MSQSQFGPSAMDYLTSNVPKASAIPGYCSFGRSEVRRFVTEVFDLALFELELARLPAATQ